MDILKEHYKKIGTKGGQATKRKYGVDFLRKVGKLGGRPKLKKVKSGLGITPIA